MDNFSSQPPNLDSSNRAGIPTSPNSHRLSFQQLAAFGTKQTAHDNAREPSLTRHPYGKEPGPGPGAPPARPAPPARRGPITLRRRRPLATGGARCRLSQGPQRHRERPPGRRGPGRGRLLPSRPGKAVAVRPGLAAFAGHCCRSPLPGPRYKSLGALLRLCPADFLSKSRLLTLSQFTSTFLFSSAL